MTTQSTFSNRMHALYSDHHRWLDIWLYRKLGCALDAADLAHDTFARIFAKPGAETIRKPRAYLTTVAHGLLVNHVRRKELERAFIASLMSLPEPQAPDPETRAIWLETLVEIDTLLAALPPRRAIKGLMLLLMAGAGGFAGYRAATAGAWFADYRTAVGERRKAILADGTRLTLNTASAADVVFDDLSRLIELRFGEMLIETATDPKRRPFRVETAHDRITALGTRFTVRDDAATSRAAVFEGRIEIEPAASSRPKRTLSAGEAARFTATRLLAIERVDESELSWVQGMLLADAMPLSEFVAELARYRRGHLACDPRVAHLRISGTFSLADTDRALASVADTLPVTVERFTDLWVTVRPR